VRENRTHKATQDATRHRKLQRSRIQSTRTQMRSKTRNPTRVTVSIEPSRSKSQSMPRASIFFSHLRVRVRGRKPGARRGCANGCLVLRAFRQSWTSGVGSEFQRHSALCLQEDYITIKMHLNGPFFVSHCNAPRAFRAADTGGNRQTWDELKIRLVNASFGGAVSVVERKQEKRRRYVSRALITGNSTSPKCKHRET